MFHPFIYAYHQLYQLVKHVNFSRTTAKIGKKNKKRTLLDKYVPIFRHWLTRETERLSMPNRKWTVSSFIVWIDLKWNNSWPCWGSFGCFCVNAIQPSTCSNLVVGWRAIGGTRSFLSLNFNPQPWYVVGWRYKRGTLGVLCVQKSF